MKLAHLLERDLAVATLWEAKYQTTKDIVLATVETCLETGENHKRILEIVSRHVKEKTIIIG
jgi:hypothetical protein